MSKRNKRFRSFRPQKKRAKMTKNANRSELEKSVEAAKVGARAQVNDACAMMLATIGSDGMLRFVVLPGTAAEDAAVAVQCRAFADSIVGLVTMQVMDTLRGMGQETGMPDAE